MVAEGKRWSGHFFDELLTMWKIFQFIVCLRALTELVVPFMKRLNVLIRSSRYLPIFGVNSANSPLMANSPLYLIKFNVSNKRTRL